MQTTPAHFEVVKLKPHVQTAHKSHEFEHGFSFTFDNGFQDTAMFMDIYARMTFLSAAAVVFDTLRGLGLGKVTIFSAAKIFNAFTLCMMGNFSCFCC